LAEIGFAGRLRIASRACWTRTSERDWGAEVVQAK